MFATLLRRSFSRCSQHRRFSRFVNEEDAHEESTRSMVADPSTPLPVIIPTAGVPIHLYTRELEGKALRQLTVLAESGIVKGFVAAMADVHVGKRVSAIFSFIVPREFSGVGATIGTVFASLTHVSPYAVGADIGCGMIAAPIDGLTVHKLNEAWKREIQQKIKTAIPTGHDARVKAHAKTDRIIRSLGPCTNYLKSQISEITRKQVCTRQFDAYVFLCIFQLGTLGSGNHFLEILHDENEQVWLMLHRYRNHCGVSGCHWDFLVDRAGSARRLAITTMPSLAVRWLNVVRRLSMS